MLLRCVSSGSGPSPPDREDLPGGGPKYADLPGPPRPQGPVFSSNPEEGFQAGIRRARLLKGSPPRVRLPITTQLLSQIRATLGKSSHPEKTALWAVLHGLFRLLPTRRAVARLARRV